MRREHSLLQQLGREAPAASEGCGAHIGELELQPAIVERSHAAAAEGSGAEGVHGAERVP